MSQAQGQQQQASVAQFMVEFWAKRNQITNVDKQKGVMEEDLIGILLKEIEARGKTIQQLTEKLQEKTKAEADAKTDKELPGRKATENEVKKAEVVNPEK